MKGKLLILMIFFAISAQVSGQTAPLLQVNVPAQSVSVCDATGVTDLTAVYPALNTTTTYVATPADVTFLPPFPTTGGTLLDATADDVWSPVVNLPFNFGFFGTFYNQVIVGSNGLISFDVTDAGGYCPWAFTATVPSPAIPTNAIFGVYQDTNIQQPPVVNPAIQNVNYYVLDTGANQAPNRVFVVNFNELPQFSCNNGVGLQTSQIVIHEGTNIIDFYVDDRTCCAGWNSGSGVIGIQNAAGTQGYVSPGAQTGCYSLDDIHYQITPTGPSVTTSLQWYQGGAAQPGDPGYVANSIPVGSTPVTGTPPPGPIDPNTLYGVGLGVYTAVVTYTYSNGDVVVISDYYEVEPYQIDMDDPIDVVICTVGTSAPYTVNIDQTAALTASATPPNPAFYDIRYYEQLIDAQSYASNFIATPGAYITSGPFPQTIWVRIEDLAGSGCVNYRPLVITDGPQGTFLYGATPYCRNLTTPQPITPTSLSPGGTFTALPNTLTINATTGEITPSTSAVGTYTVTYRITGLTPCPDWTTTATVEIVDCGCTAVASTPSDTICLGAPLTAAITYDTTAGDAVSAVISVGNLPPGTTGTFAGNTYTVNGTPTSAGVFTYTVKLTDSAGLECTVSTTITVNPNPTITLSSAVGSNNQTVCIGSALAAPLTFTIADGATGATVANLPPGMTGTLSGTTYTIGGIPTGFGTFNYTVTTTGGCTPAATATGTITVSPLSTISLLSGPNVQSVCINAAAGITNITYNVANGATGATVLGLPPGVTGTFAGSTLTISGIPTSAGVYSYTASTVGGCGTASLTGTITVDDNVTIALSSLPATAAQTVCINTPIATITYLTTNGATNVTASGLPTGVTGTFSGATFTITGTPTAVGSGTFNYTVTTVGGCSTDSETGTIIVNPDVTIALASLPASAAQTVCINTPIANIQYTVTNNPTSVNAVGLPTGVSGVLVGSTYTISGTPTVSGPFAYTLTTVGGCGSDSIGGTITVNPIATIALTSTSGAASQTVCISQAITPIEYAIADGGTGATATGLPAGITGTYSGGVFTISGATSATGPFNYTVTTQGGCPSSSLSGTITINQDVTIALQTLPATASQVVCIGSPIATIEYITTNGATNVTASGLPTGVTGSFAGGVFTITGTPTVDGLFGYTVTTVGGCAVDSESGSILINPAATISLTSVAGTDGQTVCINTPIVPIEYTVATGATGATALGLPAGLTATFAGTKLTITGTPTAAGVSNYTVTTQGGCSSSSLSGTVTVTPDVTIALNVAGTDNQTVCIGIPMANIGYVVANGATSVNDSGLPLGVTGTFVPATGAYTLSGTPTVAGTYNYTLTTVGGCSFDTATGIIIVSPNATITQISAAGIETQTLCVNTAMVNIQYTIGNGATGAIATGLPPGVAGTLVGTTFTISGTPTLAGIFNIDIDTQGGCSVGSLTATLTVNPDRTITLTSATGTDNGTACVNTNIVDIEYTIANGGTGASVTGLPTGINGVYAAGIFTISGSTSLTGTFPYTVTTSGGCGTGIVANGTITITPDVTVALAPGSGSDTQTLCINTPLTNIVYAITNGASSATVTGLPAGVIGTLSGSTFTISGTPTVSNAVPFNYNVNIIGNCGVTNIGGAITVNPNATLALTNGSATQSGCINVAIGAIEYTIANGATGAAALSLPPGVTGTLVGNVFTISGTPTVAGTYNYTVSTSGGCAIASLGGTIIVQPNVTLALNSLPATTAQTVCINTGITSITYALANVGPLGATVTGLPTGVNAAYNPATGILTISGTPTVSNATAYNYLVTTSGGCSSATATGSITVNPNVTMVLTSSAASANQTSCMATPITPIVYTIGNGATSASIVSGGLPAGITGVFSGNTFTISGSATASGVFNYEVKTNGGCSSVPLSGTITIKQNVTLQLTSATSTIGQPVCLNTPIDPITYVTGNNPTGVNVTGLPPGVVWNYVPATQVLTISGSGTVQGIYNYSITTIGGCGSAGPLGGTITLLPDATIALSSAAGTNAQIVCVGQEAITPIKYLVASGATGATVTGVLPPGITGSFDLATLTFTLSGTPTQSGIFNYGVKTTGGCSSATASGTITVIALPAIDLTQDAFICVQNGIPIPGAQAILTTGLSTTDHTFVWSNTAGVIAGANGSSYIATTPGVYIVEVTNIAEGCHDTATTTVISSYAPEVVTAVVPSYFAEEQIVTLVVSPPGSYLYQVDGGAWQESNQFINLPSGEHNFVVKDKIGCGEAPASIRLIDYPKFFTPNNDGYNDTWNINDLNMLSNQETSKIEIFDRYGKLLKQISPKGTGWDGTVNGYPLPSTDYWFKVYYHENDVSKEFRAHFSLKR